MAEAAVVEVPVLPDLTNFGTLLTAGLRGSLGGIQGILSGIQKNFGLIAGAAIAAGVGSSIKAAVQYEESFKRIDAVTNASAENLAAWKEQILDVATATAQAPQELADATYFLASAGLEMNQVMGVLEISAKGAAVGLGDVHTLALLTAQAMNAFAADGLTATQVMDSLTAAVREGAVEPDALAASLGRVMPIAGAVGVEFGEVTGAIAAMTNAGLDAYESTTALRQLLANTVAPSVEAANAMSQMGISTELLRETIREKGLLAGLDLLGRKSKMNFDVMRRIIPNIRALAGFFNLTRDEMKQATEIIEQTTHAGGDLSSAWADTQKNVSFQLEQLGNNFEVLKVRTGEAFLPLINVGVKALNAFVPLLGTLADNAHLVVAAFVAWKFLPATITAVRVALELLGFTSFSNMLIGVDSLKSLGLALQNVVAATPMLRRFVLTMGGFAPAAAALLGVVDVIGIAISTVGDTAENAEKVVGNIKVMGETLEIPANVLARLRDDSTGFVHNLSIFTQDLLTAGQGGAEIFGEYEEKLSDVRRAIDAAATSGKTADQITQNLGQHAGEIVKTFDQFEPGSPEAIDRLTEIATGVSHITDAQKEAAGALEASLKLGIIQAKDLVPRLGKVEGLLSLMGTSAQDFGADIVTALNKGQPQFNKFVDDTLKKAQQLLEETASSFAQSINFGANALDEFINKQKQSVNTFITNLGKAKKQTEAFGADLLEISRHGGEALAQALASAGTEGASAAARIADGTDKMRDRAIAAFNKVNGTAAEFGGKISTAILGTLQDIQAILEQISAKAFDATLNTNVATAEAQMSSFFNTWNGRTINVNLGVTTPSEIRGIDGNAAGGPVRGGVPTIVGELGPELFVPRTSGKIIANKDLKPRAHAAAGGNGQVNVTLSRRKVLDELDRQVRYAGR